MAWREGYYYYTVRLLRYIADNWNSLYTDGIEFSEERATTNPFDIAEFRADFDISLHSLSKRQRKVIEADRDGVSDNVLEQRGYWEIKKFRRQGYHLMKLYLNGELND